MSCKFPHLGCFSKTLLWLSGVENLLPPKKCQALHHPWPKPLWYCQEPSVRKDTWAKAQTLALNLGNICQTWVIPNQVPWHQLMVLHRKTYTRILSVHKTQTTRNCKYLGRQGWMLALSQHIRYRVWKILLWCSRGSTYFIPEEITTKTNAID